MTNYEKIKSMSVKEMAREIHNQIGYTEMCDGCPEIYNKCGNSKYCVERMKEWLKSEAAMTCKDCIHYEQCTIMETSSEDDKEQYVNEYGCKDFLNRAEVAEVKHGKWEDPDDKSLLKFGGWKCSECEYTFCGDKYKYCPNCGARMDLEVQI